MSRFINKTLKEISRQKKETASENKKKAKREFWKDLLIIGLAGIASIQVGYQIYIAEESMEIANRAYIKIFDMEPNFTNDNLEVVMIFKNDGQTPARKVRGTAILIAAANEDSLEVELKREPIKIPQRAIFMGKNNTYILTPGRSFDQESIDVIKSKLSKSKIFLCGKITYVDIFGNKRCLEWRFKYNSTDGVFEFCRNGNNDDCG